ncbi:MAG: SIS domain-containing protein [Desulfurococcales archaeon]|nr:SIS domain-containing protein [Desulfurococcales archaeon]
MTGFAEEVKEEAKLYPSIYSRQLEKTDIVLHTERIFVSGAGDSFAASLTGTALSGYRGEAVDPRELSLYPKGERVTVIAVSLGGRTKSLIESVSLHKDKGSKVVVVTGNTESPLAELGDMVVQVVHPSYVKGSGFGSYVSMTAAIAGLLGVRVKPAGKLQCYPGNIPVGIPFFIGEAWSYGLAYFAMLKMHEGLGWPSRSERLEQFMHATIFSLKEYETPIILYPREELPENLISTLTEKSSPVFLGDLINSEAVNDVDKMVCTAQSLTRLIAECISREGLIEPFYRRRRSEAGKLAKAIYT